jgi:hypothetical protein
MSEPIKFEAVEKLSKLKFNTREIRNLSRIDTISPPSVFIGSKLRYPNVNVGILSPLEKEENVSIYDDAKSWAKNNFSIQNVLRLRENLLNSRFQSNVSDARLNNKFVGIARDVAVALRPVDVEIEFKEKINVGKRIDRVLTPHGLKAGLKDAKIVSNVKVHHKVDRVMNDEIKAGEGIKYLYNNSFDEYSLQKVLSVGALGLKKDKRLVPTRWSITATDDIIGKDLISELRGFQVLENYECFFGEFMGNQYLIMLFPDVWSFELFELYYPGSSWNPSSEMKASTDYESFEGRKSYASNCVGGYYATRFPITEYLKSIKRQASVLVIRLETPSYWAALGVWVVRESVRKALDCGAMKFETKKELIDNIKKIAKIKYDFDSQIIFNKSILLKTLGQQKKLGEWL